MQQYCIVVGLYITKTVQRPYISKAVFLVHTLYISFLFVFLFSFRSFLFFLFFFYFLGFFFPHSSSPSAFSLSLYSSSRRGHVGFRSQECPDPPSLQITKPVPQWQVCLELTWHRDSIRNGHYRHYRALQTRISPGVQTAQTEILPPHTNHTHTQTNKPVKHPTTLQITLSGVW